MPEPVALVPPKFTNTFLLSRGDESGLAVVTTSEADSRRKRAHRKSRNGCAACKRRKVKCDESYPCAYCVKRNEPCSLNLPRRAPSLEPANLDEDVVPPFSSFPLPIRLDPLPNADSRVNLLHMELFHHFEKVTAPTLSFPEIWDTMIRLSFHEEYLMNAILSVSARHIAVLRPGQERYSRAAMVLLSKSCADFREVLNRELTSSNCDALLGTSILIHYLTWCDIDFVVDSGKTPGSHLDLSQDKLFLLSPGVRQIFFMSWPFLQEQRSVFVGLAVYKPCNVLERIVEARGLNWKGVVGQFVDMYDDPRLMGCEPSGRSKRMERTRQSSASASLSATNSSAEDPDPLAVVSAAPPPPTKPRYLCGLAHQAPIPTDVVNFQSFDEYLLTWMRISRERGSSSSTSPTTSTTHPSRCVSPDPRADVSSSQEHNTLVIPPSETDARAAYGRVITRLAVILTFLKDQTVDARTSAPPHNAASFLVPRRADIERYFLSFPLLCMGKFLEMILEGDSRALIVLYHLYRAARLLIGVQDSWWATERSTVMERLIGRELMARGQEKWLSLDEDWSLPKEKHVKTREEVIMADGCPFIRPWADRE